MYKLMPLVKGRQASTPQGFSVPANIRAKKEVDFPAIVYSFHFLAIMHLKCIIALLCPGDT
jgi:hypothetical protein